MKALLTPILLCAAMGTAHAAPAQNQTAGLAGEYDLWEDFEGGRVCALTLTDAPTIGGDAAEGDEDCIAQLGLDGDVFAWFIAEDERLVLADAMRRVLVRFNLTGDGVYYAIRAEAGLENLVLSPR